MAVDVELDAKRRPGGQAEESQSPLRIQEIEIIMQTLARIRPQAPTLFLLVLAQPIGVTSLHGRENTDQARPVAPLRQERCDTIFLAYLLTQKLDLNAFGGRESFGAILDLIGQRRRPLGIVFNTRYRACARIVPCRRRSKCWGACPGASAGRSRTARR